MQRETCACVCVQNIVCQKKHFHLSREPFLCIQVSGTQVFEISMRARRDVRVNVARKCDCRWGLSMIFDDPHLVDQATSNIRSLCVQRETCAYMLQGSVIVDNPHLVDQATPIWWLSTITLPCNMYAHVSLCTHRDLRDLCTRDVYAEKRLTRIWWLSIVIVESDCWWWLLMMIVKNDCRWYLTTLIWWLWTMIVDSECRWWLSIMIVDDI